MFASAEIFVHRVKERAEVAQRITLNAVIHIYSDS